MFWLVAIAAAAPPSIDTPVRTGLKSPADSAIVVGVEDYFMLPDVPYAERDAQSFRDFLRYSRGLSPESLTLLTGNANRELILSSIEQAAGNAKEGGTLWVYFAGHGAASPTDGQRMLLGVDAQADARMFEGRAVRLSEIENLVANSAADQVMVVLDTCYGGVGRSGEELLPGSRFAFPEYVTGPPAKVTVWTAASANELSGPYEPAAHGAFTYFVLGGMRGWADGELGEADGQVTLDEAEAYVQRSLRTVGQRGQTPTREGHANALSWVLVNGAIESEPGAKRDRQVVDKRVLFAPPDAIPGQPPASWTTQAVIGDDKRFVWTEDLVWDTATGLSWTRRAPAGEHACEALDLDGGAWRLPSHRPLARLIGDGLPGAVFPEAAKALISSRNKGIQSFTTFAVHGGDGHVESVLILDAPNGLCVRGGVPDPGPTLLWRVQAETGALPDWLQADPELHAILARREPPTVRDVPLATPGKPQKAWAMEPIVKKSKTHVATEHMIYDVATGLTWLRKPRIEDNWRDLADLSCVVNPVDGGGWRLPDASTLGTFIKGVDLEQLYVDWSVGLATLDDTDPGPGIDGNGDRFAGSTSKPLQALCVRDGVPVRPPMTDDDYEQVGAKITSQHATGLLWTRQALIAQRRDVAERECSGLSYEGLVWRLPRVYELEDLLEIGVGTPLVNALHFRGVTGPVWTDEQTGDGWRVVDFNTGETTSTKVTADVLCVSRR